MPFTDAALQQLVITSPQQVSLLKANAPDTQAPAVSEVSCYMHNAIHPTNKDSAVHIKEEWLVYTVCRMASQHFIIKMVTLSKGTFQ